MQCWNISTITVLEKVIGNNTFLWITGFPTVKSLFSQRKKSHRLSLLPSQPLKLSFYQTVHLQNKPQHICFAPPTLESAGASPWGICWPSALCLLWIPAWAQLGLLGCRGPHWLAHLAVPMESQWEGGLKAAPIFINSKALTITSTGSHHTEQAGCAR